MSYRRLEEISQNASRPERGLMIDGWSIGLSPGAAKRSRCVNPFYRSERPFAANLATARQAFAAAGLPCIFRLTPWVADPAIDGQLDAAGYARFDTTLVMALPLAELDLSHVRAHVLRFAPAADLAQAAHWVGEMRGDSAAEAEALGKRWQLNAALVDPLFAFTADNVRVARTVTIIEDGHAGVFDVGTDPAHRGAGHATALLEHQLTRARDAGARTAYLQVTPQNSSRRIYERFGFRTIYEYWYRALPADAH
jgi:ribosomal protein S18 acetylase RimI-like enzyme